MSGFLRFSRNPLTLKKQLWPLRAQLAQAAQAVVDEWDQDEEGYDEECGTGGICDQIADAMATVISTHLNDVEIDEGGQEGDDHAYLLISSGKETVIVDIPPGTYETGGGYNWRKRKNATITADDVVIEDL